VGARKKSEDQSHALGCAPSVVMPRQIEAERATLPSSGHAGLASAECMAPVAELLAAPECPQAWGVHRGGVGPKETDQRSFSDGPRDLRGGRVAARPRARKKALEGAMMPLDYLLGIMRDKDPDARSRLEAAKPLPLTVTPALARPN